MESLLVCHKVHHGISVCYESRSELLLGVSERWYLIIDL
jgi:hypothetical protein